MHYCDAMSSLPPGDEVRQIVTEALQAARREAGAGNPGQAVALYGAVLDLQPGHAGAHHGLGLLARQAGDPATAIPHFAAALQSDPNEPDHWLDYLDALVAARQFATALELLALGRQHGLEGKAADAIERQLATCSAPDAATIDAAAALFNGGQLEEAGNAAYALIEQFPQHAFGWKLLGGVQHQRGDLAQSLHALRTAAAHAPDDAETLSNLGLALMRAGELAESHEVLLRATALQPDNAHAHNHLAITLMEMGQLADAHAAVDTALALAPQHRQAGNTLAQVLQQRNRPLEAVDIFRSVLARDPDHTDAHSNLLFCLSQMAGVTPADLTEEHRAYGRRIEARARPSQTWDNTRAPERTLRVGFISGDLRNHAVAHFIEPVFERLAGRPSIVVHAYYNFPLHDAVTERLRSHVAHWRDVAGLNDAALDALVRADGIDILVDLSGHTSFNRLPALARKPAPVQASWIGYPGTTGLTAVDYYMADRLLLPPGQYDHLFTEKLALLPLFVPFEPTVDAPDVVPLPALANGYITFGSFNRLSKFSRDVVALWGPLLRAMPTARLLVAGIPEHGNRQLLEWLGQEGVDATRVDFHGRTGLRDYLALHNRVDLCLDTFPYTGGTTTLHAGWMGVPTLTLAGGTLPGRQSASCLEHWGLPQFIARDADDFLARGLAACADLAALDAQRACLRGWFPLPTSDAMTRIADSVELALRMMWRRWCAGLPAASFEVPADTQL